MRYNLSKKITLAMIAVAVGGIFLSALLINLALTWNFGHYLGNVQEVQNQLILDTLAELYAESTSWQAIRLSTIHVGSTTGTQIRVFDQGKRLIADSLSGMMQGMQGGRWKNVQENRSQVYNYPLYVLGQRVGTVEITHLGQEGIWTAEALIFRRTVQISALITVMVAILVAALVGSKLSKRLTGRLTVLTAAAENWGQGSFKSRVRLHGDDELAVLGTTMNRMAARLDEQSALRKKLTGDISHELRTPLTTIQSYLEAFRDGVLPTDKGHLLAVLEESHRLGQLVTDLQELTNNEIEGNNARLLPFLLNPFVSREAERYRPLLQQKKIELTVDIPQEDILVCVDEALMVRIIGNLLSNAAKYTPDGGHVHVSVSSVALEAVIAVEDTGIGIAAEHLPYIFERFYRVDPSRARATGGSGIGLAIVKELVEAMSGRVDVVSTPGKGSKFQLFFKRQEIV